MTKPLAFALLSICLLTKVFSETDDGALTKAKQLITLMEVTRNIDRSFVHVEEMYHGMIDSQSLSDSEKAKAKRAASDAMRASVDAVREMDWETLFAEIYASVLTEEELDALVEFYSSPAGRKFLEKQPELMKATMQRMQSEMAKIMPRIEAEIEKVIHDAKH